MRPLWLSALLGIATILWSVAIAFHVIALGWLAWQAFEAPDKLGDRTFLATAAAVATMPLAILAGLRLAWRLSRRGRAAAAILAIVAPLFWPVLLAVVYGRFGIETAIEFHWPATNTAPPGRQAAAGLDATAT
ncbi:MAG: hypothetical protein ACT4N4_08525 [Rhodospirillales bacterium]